MINLLDKLKKEFTVEENRVRKDRINQRLPVLQERSKQDEATTSKWQEMHKVKEEKRRLEDQLKKQRR